MDLNEAMDLLQELSCDRNADDPYRLAIEKVLQEITRLQEVNIGLGELLDLLK